MKSLYHIIVNISTQKERALIISAPFSYCVDFFIIMWYNWLEKYEFNGGMIWEKF